MAKGRAQKEAVRPSLPPQRGIELLRQQITNAEQIERIRYDSPEVKRWVLTTENILHGAFGKPDGEPHENAKAFTDAVRIYSFAPLSDSEYQSSHVERTQTRKALLESAIEQLDMLAPPATRVAEGRYDFHPAIQQVSGQLLRDGHYKQAAFEAYVRVLEEVKQRSGLALDGDQLVNRAFGIDSQTPMIQFNSLQTAAEKDEQKGILFLFKGVVGLRNAKAHSNRLFNDPYRAHEYLAIASLLMRLMEIARVNPPS